MMKGRRTRADARPFATAVAAFVVLCGLVMAIAGGHFGPISTADADAPDPNRPILDSLQATQRAQAALQNQNYGDVRRYLEDAQDSLARLLAERAEQ